MSLAATSDFFLTNTSWPQPYLQRLSPDAILAYTSLSSVGGNHLTAAQASFEDGTTGGWAAGADTTLSNTTAAAVDGTHSLQAVGGTGIAHSLSLANIPVVAGNVYSFLAMIRMVVGSSDSIWAQVSWFTAASSLISTDYSYITAGYFSPTTSFTQYAYTNATAPATATKATLSYNGSATSMTYYYDQIGVMDGNTTTWLAPGTPILSDITDDPDSPDTNWLNGVSATASALRVSFPTPAGQLLTGDFKQEFRVRIRPRP